MKEEYYTMNCPKCGADNADSALFCGSCGQPIKVSQPEEKTVQADNYDNESDTLEEEQKRLDKKRSKKSGKLFKRVMIGVLAVIVVGLGTVIGIGLYQQHVRDSMTYADKLKTTDNYKNFNSEYGSEYSDPVATYNAVFGDNSTIFGELVSSSDAKKYSFDNDKQNVNSAQPDTLFGFKVLTDKVVSGYGKEDAVSLFNKYTRDQIGRYLNAIAKNPQHTDIVNQRFKDYCGINVMSGYESDETTAKEYINNTIQKLSAVANKYGSNSNFSVIEAVSDTQDENHTTCADALSGKDANGNAQHQDDFDQLLIQVKTYDDNDKCTTTIERVNDFDMVFKQDKDEGWWTFGVR